VTFSISVEEGIAGRIDANLPDAGKKGELYRKELQSGMDV